MFLEDEVVMTEKAGGAAVEDTARDQAPENAPDGQNGEPEKKYTDKDVDRIVSRRLERERRKMAQAAPDQRESELNEREKNLLAREQEIIKRELKATAICELASAGLPVAAADLLSYESDDSYKESFEKLQNIIEEQRKAWEKDRARGRVPSAYRTETPPDPIASAFKPIL